MQSKAPSALGKGQMRCFDCRQPGLIKEGHWQDRGNQQVFVCKTCEFKNRVPSKAERPGPKSGVRGI